MAASGQPVKLVERYQLSPAGLHVTPAKRAARSHADPAGRGGGKVVRPVRSAAASSSGSGEQVQFRSSHLRHHTLYPSEASSLYKLLPDEYAPYWMRAPVLSRFLDRLALLCIAEVSVHAVHVLMIWSSVDFIVFGVYLTCILGKALLAAHLCLVCYELVPLSRYSYFIPQRMDEHSAVMYPLQSSTIQLQKRACFWSATLIGMVLAIVPYTGFRPATVAVPGAGAVASAAASAPASVGPGASAGDGILDVFGTGYLTQMAGLSWFSASPSPPPDAGIFLFIVAAAVRIIAASLRPGASKCAQLWQDSTGETKGGLVARACPYVLLPRLGTRGS